MGTYVITGATGGIGAAVAGLLYERGHTLILAGRSPDRLAETIAALGPDRVRAFVVDLADPRGIAAATEAAALPAALDGVVHSAGVLELGTIEEARVDDWLGQLLVNAAAPAELTRVLLPALRAARGHVVFVNSGSGLRAKPRWGAYAASKHALRALADALREEEDGLRVTSVYPGRTAGEMQRKVRAQEGGDYDPSAYMSAETVARVIVDALETPREATVTDVSVRS